MKYAWSKQSLERRQGVHPDLLAVCDKAISEGEMDITVLPDGGIRTPEKEAEMVERGTSQTMNSKHLIQHDGYGHAIDIAPYPVDWHDIDGFKRLGTLMKECAYQLKIDIEWGGDWTSFKDYSHYQLKEKI